MYGGKAKKRRPLAGLQKLTRQRFVVMPCRQKRANRPIPQQKRALPHCACRERGAALTVTEEGNGKREAEERKMQSGTPTVEEA
jgi:hypothetical protein